jgi:hypothetical protein
MVPKRQIRREPNDNKHLLSQTSARPLIESYSVSKEVTNCYRSGRSPDWLKMKNPEAPAVQREEEDWGR